MMEPSVGSVLRAAREQKKLTREELHAKTRILPQYIRYLEEDKFDFLPEPYVRGFLRTLCNALELDPEPLLEQVKAILHPWQPEPSEETPGSGRRTRAKPSHLGDFVVMGLILALVGSVAYGYFRFRARWLGTESARVEEIPLEKGVAEQQELVSPPPDTQATAEARARGLMKLVLRSTDSCWVRIVADDSLQYEFLFTPGVQRTIEAASQFYLKCGNAGGLAVALNDRDLGVLGKPGEVLEVWIDAKGELRRRAPGSQRNPEGAGLTP
jgi:cytoskeletal protein RodZ